MEEVPSSGFLTGSLPVSKELLIRLVIIVEAVEDDDSSKMANCSPVWGLHMCSVPSHDATLFPGNKQMSTTA